MYHATTFVWLLWLWHENISKVQICPEIIIPSSQSWSWSWLKSWSWSWSWTRSLMCVVGHKYIKCFQNIIIIFMIPLQSCVRLWEGLPGPHPCEPQNGCCRNPGCKWNLKTELSKKILPKLVNSWALELSNFDIFSSPTRWAPPCIEDLKVCKI